MGDKVPAGKGGQVPIPSKPTTLQTFGSITNPIREECYLTKEQLKGAMQNATDADIEKYLTPINNTLKKYKINTPLRVAHFLAQLAHESGSLKYVREIDDGKAYEGGKDLGNIMSGDGTKFKGRGLIQLTGRANYEKYGNYILIDLINNPEKVEQPHIAADAAGWFWYTHKLNELADQDDIKGITKKINGGDNGLEDRKKYLQKAKNAGLCKEKKSTNGITVQCISCDPNKKIIKKEHIIYENRKAIQSAARTIRTDDLRMPLENTEISADLIGAVMLDELQQKKDWSVDIGRKSVSEFIRLNDGPLENIGLSLLSKLLSNKNKSIEDISLGPAHMKLKVVEELINEGLIRKPANWNSDKIDIAIKWLLEPQKSAELIGARLEQTVRHWAKGGVDISNKPEILGTLYSMGLEGENRVHKNPEANERGERIKKLMKRVNEILRCCGPADKKKRKSTNRE